MNCTASSAPALVIGVTATFRRPQEVNRLLASLAALPPAFGGLVLIDNADDPATRAAAEKAGVRVEYHAPGKNLGCGGGLNLGEKLALERFGPAVTHLWILDDDCEVAPDSLPILLEEMERTGAGVAHPLTIDAEGQLSWFPGLLDATKFRCVQARQTPEEFIAQCGAAPVPFSWSQGIALLVSRPWIDRLGFHRTDYWVRGEDLEFSLRLTARTQGIYVPRARVRHLPPAGSGQPEAEYIRFAAMLQNIAYTALRLSHGRRIARNMPGNWWRFLRAAHLAPRAFWEAARAFFCGAVLGWPAGKTYGKGA